MTSADIDVVSVFVLGDLHFPEFTHARTNIDVHDAHPPGDVTDSLELPLAAVVKDSLLTQIAASSNPVVLICGDITTRGNLTEYENGIRFLADVLTDPSVEGNLTAERIHIVPGNHDISYKSPEGEFQSINDTSRFEQIREVVTGAIGDLLAIDSRRTQPSFGSKALDIMSINTCLGSGAPRSFALTYLPGTPAESVPTSTSEARSSEPEPERAEVNEPDSVETVGPISGETTKTNTDGTTDPEASGGFESQTKTADPTPSAPTFTAEDEVLDVPLIHARQLAAIDLAFASNDEPLRVVLAHHALLPQHIPRLNPYTEMINAGQARHALTSIRKPLLYIHGHIHADVIEVVRVPDGFTANGDSTPLICISAPELREGYHRIDVHYRPTGEPVGIEVTTWRLEPGAIRMAPATATRRVALADPEPVTSRRRKLTQFIAESAVARGDELVAFGAAAKPAISAQDVEVEVENMVWAGFVAPTDVTSRPTFIKRGYRLV